MRYLIVCGLFICAAPSALAAQNTSAETDGEVVQDDFAPSQTPLANEVADARVELAVLPTYPKRALRAGIDGEVTVVFTVSRYGRAVDARVVSASPRRVFDSATLDALKYWFIRPARADVCSTVEQRAEQTFRFVHNADPAVQLLPIVLEGRPTLPEQTERVGVLDQDVGLATSSAAPQDGQLVVVHRVEPAYPEKALQRRREGFVTVSFFIEKDGSVSEARIESAQRGALFGRAALSAIGQWKFAPALRNGEPIERLGCHEFLFNLDARDQKEKLRRQRERTRGFTGN